MARVARVRGVRIRRTMGGMSEANDSKVNLDVPEHLEYSDEHVWVDSSVEPAMVGVTEYATEQFGELVYIDLPEVGTQVEAGDEVAEFESSKAVTALVSPVAGTIRYVNNEAADDPSIVTDDPYGEVLGEIPVFDPHGGPRTASAVAMTNGTRVVWLEHDALFDWLDEHPRVAVDMLQVLAHRMRSNNERICDLVFMDVPGRLAKTLLNLASRFGEPVEAGLKVPHDLTQEEMAQLVGSSRETVNKALMDFANRGWIAREGRSIIIYQPGMLIRRSRR